MSNLSKARYPKTRSAAAAIAIPHHSAECEGGPGEQGHIFIGVAVASLFSVPFWGVLAWVALR